MKLSDRKISRFLYAIQGLGAVFVGVFLAAYLGGLPTTTVLHSEPVFRIPLFVVGAVLLFLLTSAFIPVILSDGSETGAA